MISRGSMTKRAHTMALTAFGRLPPVVRRTLVRAGKPGFTVGAVCAVAYQDTYLALRQPHRPGWSLPGGLLNRGESAAEGVVREVREETGLRIEVGLPVTVLVVGKVRRVDVVYRISVTERPAVTAGGEATEVGWLPPERIAKGADGPTRQILDVLARIDDASAYQGAVVGTP